MKIKVRSMNEVMLNGVRREWGFNPCSRAIQSKKRYNRKDKSWKNEF